MKMNIFCADGKKNSAHLLNTNVDNKPINSADRDSLQLCLT